MGSQHEHPSISPGKSRWEERRDVEKEARRQAAAIAERDLLPLHPRGGPLATLLVLAF